MPIPRLYVWLGALAATGVAWGVGWLGQPVTMPLGAVLILTFVPAFELIEVLRLRVQSLKPKEDPKHE